KLGHVITGPDGAFERWSDTLEHVMGLDASHMPRSTRAWLEIIHPADRTLFRNWCIEAGKKHVRMDVEYRVPRADGTLMNLREVAAAARHGCDPPGSAGGTYSSRGKGDERWDTAVRALDEQVPVCDNNMAAQPDLRRLQRRAVALGYGSLMGWPRVAAGTRVG